jgi:hypothetical protein
MSLPERHSSGPDTRDYDDIYLFSARYRAECRLSYWRLLAGPQHTDERPGTFRSPLFCLVLCKHLKTMTFNYDILIMVYFLRQSYICAKINNNFLTYPTSFLYNPDSYMGHGAFAAPSDEVPTPPFSCSHLPLDICCNILIFKVKFLYASVGRGRYNYRLT